MTHTRLVGSFVLGVLSIGSIVIPHTSFATSSCVTLTTSFTKGASDTSTNKSVSQLQGFLFTQGLLSSQPTGYFGSLTFKAVQAFQTANHLAAIGVVGPLTRVAIQKQSCVATSTPPAPTESAPSTHASTVGQTETPPSSQQASVITAVATPPANTSATSLPYHTESFVGWTGTWGSVATSSDGLLVQANASTTGAEAIFLDSKAWTNYRYSADVSTNNGDITLIGRYRDEDNFLACTFIGNTVTISERSKGVTKTVASVGVDGVSRVPAPRRTWVSLQVVGPTIGCSQTSATANVTYTTSTSDALTGGIGAQTYFSIPNDTTLGLYEVRVDPL